MRTIQQNIDDWLRSEAHVVAGSPFQYQNLSCVPVVSEHHTHDTETPIGFLLTHGTDVAFVDAHTPEGESIMAVWTKTHILEVMEERQELPAECWYG